jgi:ribosomal protein S18 acetylase RimI-like enzyme
VAAVDPGERERLVGFLSTTDRAVAGEVTSVPVTPADGGARAWAITDAHRPLLWDANYLYVQERRGASAEALALAARRVLGRGGCASGGIVIAEGAEGDLLADDFAALGWRAAPLLLMVHRGTVRLPAGPAARAMSEEEARPARRAVILAESWASEEIADQILSRDALIARVLDGVSYGAEHEGAVASTCIVLRRGAIAQVDNVGTVPAARRRGLARAVASLATAQARQQAELVFLCADADDWPRHLYRQLGYEAVDVLHRFLPVFPELADG